MLESKVEFSSRNEEVTAVEVLLMTCLPNRTVPMGETSGTQLWHRVCLGPFVHRCTKSFEVSLGHFLPAAAAATAAAAAAAAALAAAGRFAEGLISAIILFGISELQPNTVRFECEIFG